MEYLFVILIPVLAVVTVAVLAKRIASHTFRCRHCGGEFNISRSRAFITMHSDNEYMLLCPYCKTKDWCTQLPKSNK